MSLRKVKILGTGKYLPGTVITAEELDARLSLREGWTRARAGVRKRHFVRGETASFMAAAAAREALERSGLELGDLDCLISASSAAEQAIPCGAALVQRELGGQDTGIPCFDVNSTCLSFVTALDLVSYMLEAGRYTRVLIVSSEVASVALNWEDPRSSTLFGDGAAAVVVGRTPPGEGSGILSSAMETYSRGAGLAEIRGGGTGMPPREYREETRAAFLFAMDGPEIYRLAARHLPDLTRRMLEEAGTDLASLDLVIPHQASLLAMRLMQKRLKVPEGKFMYIIEDHGNTVAASLPMTLHEAVVQERLRRGNRCLLIGTSAGLSIGGMVLEY